MVGIPSSATMTPPMAVHACVLHQSRHVRVRFVPLGTIQSHNESPAKASCFLLSLNLTGANLGDSHSVWIERENNSPRD